MGDEAMAEAELTTASGAAPELVRRLVALGVVPGRDGERPFVPGDIHRVRLAQAFERSGIPLEAIGAAVASGHLSFDFVDQLFVGHLAHRPHVPGDRRRPRPSAGDAHPAVRDVGPAPPGPPATWSAPTTPRPSASGPR